MFPSVFSGLVAWFFAIKSIAPDGGFGLHALKGLHDYFLLGLNTMFGCFFRFRFFVGVGMKNLRAASWFASISSCRRAVAGMADLESMT
jgi:hypothetical protein